MEDQVLSVEAHEQLAVQSQMKDLKGGAQQRPQREGGEGYQGPPGGGSCRKRLGKARS